MLRDTFKEGQIRYMNKQMEDIINKKINVHFFNKSFYNELVTQYNL